ncbi:MAG: apolipoprotein N-acyltransferase [Prevotellaceae bacterium]|jgi:apolipoprotein N-acyltransferase|nr:apolipoprotein N-acyltransferase [Prevotellaceae bacterium]
MTKRNLILSLSGAILLSLPWYAPFPGLLLWVAWLPLLALEHNFSQRRARGCWKYYALTFVLWNLFTTWWIYRATLFGAVGAVLGNSLQMFVIFALFRWVKRHAGSSIGYTFLVALWLAWEYFYFDAEISWPWLVLGHGFAKDIPLIQWIDYTGVLGLSLWVWLVNLLLFTYLKFIARRLPLPFRSTGRRRLAFHLLLFATLVPGPVVLSLVRFHTYREPHAPCHVVVVQPNIDPYRDKFGNMTAEQQLNVWLTLAGEAADSATHYVVAPETVFGNVVENTMEWNGTVRRIRDFAQQYPHLSVIAGMSSYRFYPAGERPTHTAHRMDDGYYDNYNSAVQIARIGDFQVYHKSKLVIGVEKLPYPQYLRFLEDWAIDLGGITGSLATDNERHVFTVPGSPFRTGVAICYESVYGRFYTEYVKNGANLMFVITNDGWWGNTPGYRQHLTYASLRAVETRRSIARSANTGISALINQRGEITERTGWWTPATLKGTLHANDEMTFYVTHGDYIGRLACLVALLMFLVALGRWIPRQSPGGRNFRNRGSATLGNR